MFTESFFTLLLGLKEGWDIDKIDTDITKRLCTGSTQSFTYMKSRLNYQYAKTKKHHKKRVELHDELRDLQYNIMRASYLLEKAS